MRTKLLLALICLLAVSEGQAHPNIDSLYDVWKDPTRADTIRLKAMYKFIQSGYLFTRPDTAYELAQEEFEFAEKNGLKNFMGVAMNTMGISCAIRGDLSKAAELFTKAAAIFEQKNDLPKLASTLNNLGNVYDSKGEQAQAITYLTRSLKIAEAMHDSTLMARALGNIGVIYYNVEDYAHAMEYYERRLVLATRINDEQCIAEVLNNMGSLFTVQGDTAKAIDFYERSIAVSERIDYGQQLANTLVNLGALLAAQHKPAQAMAYFEQGLELARKLDDKENISACLAAIGDLYRAQGDPIKALKYGEQALAFGREVESVSSIREAASLLYSLHKAAGRSREALAMHELYTTMKDSAVSEENKKGVMSQKFQYDYEKKEAQLHAEQEKKDALAREELRRKKLQRNAFVGGFVLMILLAGVFFTQRNRISKEKKRSEELLLNILPAEVAEELKVKGEAEARLIPHVTVLFTDFKGFTAMSEKVGPKELVKDLHECFSAFDGIMERHGLEKIKTIGDAYMAAGGLPVENSTHAEDAVRAAFEMRDFVEAGKARKIAAGLPYFEIRIGIHTGPVVAGIVGIKKFQYDIWGDTVNTASRMESSGEVGQVNISEATYALVKDEAGLSFTSRGKVQAKGKGEMEMYFVSRSLGEG